MRGCGQCGDGDERDRATDGSANPSRQAKCQASLPRPATLTLQPSPSSSSPARRRPFSRRVTILATGNGTTRQFLLPARASVICGRAAMPMCARRSGRTGTSSACSMDPATGGGSSSMMQRRRRTIAVSRHTMAGDPAPARRKRSSPRFPCLRTGNGTYATRRARRSSASPKRNDHPRLPRLSLPTRNRPVRRAPPAGIGRGGRGVSERWSAVARPFR